MAKIIKMNPAPKGNKDFQDLCIGNVTLNSPKNLSLPFGMN